MRKRSILKIEPRAVRDLIDRCLAEDVSTGDVTTVHSIPSRSRAVARIVAREAGIAAGMDLPAMVYRRLSRSVRVRTRVGNGIRFRKGTVLAECEGPAQPILTGERIVLNLLTHLCGIATLTREYVQAAENAKVQVKDTRKTLPGLRAVEKHAVACGGGSNHRMGLYDQVMLKDNHLAVLAKQKDFPGLQEYLEQLRKRLPKRIRIEVEADNLTQVKQLARAPIDILMLDNMRSRQLRRAVEIVREIEREVGRKTPIILEASGNVTLRTIGRIAKTGVNWISVGRLTHSAPSIDLGMDVEIR